MNNKHQALPEQKRWQIGRVLRIVAKLTFLLEKRIPKISCAEM